MGALSRTKLPMSMKGDKLDFLRKLHNNYNEAHNHKTGKGFEIDHTKTVGKTYLLSDILAANKKEDKGVVIIENALNSKIARLLLSKQKETIYYINLDFLPQGIVAGQVVCHYEMYNETPEYYKGVFLVYNTYKDFSAKPKFKFSPEACFIGYRREDIIKEVANKSEGDYIISIDKYLPIPKKKYSYEEIEKILKHKKVINYLSNFLGKIKEDLSITVQYQMRDYVTN